MGEVIEHCACSPSWWCGAAELVLTSKHIPITSGTSELITV